ncbi:histidine kinase [Couchioplanes caeruleus]|uniref:sensor histidine kinase n=1 Tax=Couchioplanes caeruleus TaxID=56438 RepID=UPI00201C8F76|nr:histidine kinase [Couchioplanes caeruleus]UQU66873.1 histidine kinase [Couchioplanes caeruleus]
MRRHAMVDAVTVGLAAMVGLLLMYGPAAAFRPYGPGGVAVLAAFAVALWWRRSAPGAVAWIVAGLSIALVLVEALVPGSVLRPSAGQLTVLVAPAAPFAAYAVALYAGRSRAAWLAVAVLTAVATAPWLASPGRFRSGLLLIGIPVLLGLYAGARRRLLEALRDRAERAERERDLRAAEAVTRERARLTAEMHDVVSHRVSLIVLEAGALGLTSADATTLAAAERIRAAGCSALDELRELVRVLPEPDDHEDAPQPLPDLAPLVAAAQTAGTQVEVVELGIPVPVAPIVGRTVYRLVQEGLTNVRKHAAGAPAQLRLAHGEKGLDLSIRNLAATVPPDPALAASGSGTGLLGLRQRIELVGGSFTAGPCADGGFEVRAEFPGLPDR